MAHIKKDIFFKDSDSKLFFYSGIYIENLHHTLRHKDNYIMSNENKEKYLELKKRYERKKKDCRRTKSLEFVNFEKPEIILTKEFFN